MNADSVLSGRQTSYYPDAPSAHYIFTVGVQTDMIFFGSVEFEDYLLANCTICVIEL